MSFDCVRRLRGFAFASGLASILQAPTWGERDPYTQLASSKQSVSANVEDYACAARRWLYVKYTTSPIPSHTKNRIHVTSGNPIIRIMQHMIDRIGTSGTNGTRKLRGRSGCFFRSTMTPADTTTNANSVPMFDNSANVSMSHSPAGTPTKIPAIHVLMCGV